MGNETQLAIGSIVQKFTNGCKLLNPLVNLFVLNDIVTAACKAQTRLD